MTPFRTNLLAALALGMPAAADPATDYDRLRATFPGLIIAGEPEAMLQAQTNALQALEGRWVLIGALLGDDGSFPSSDEVQMLCDRIASTLAVTGPAAISLTRSTDNATLTVQLTYAGGTSYVASYDQQGYIDLFLGKPVEEIDGDMLYTALTGNLWLGYVSLLPVSTDLVLVQPQGSPPDLLLRCP